MNTTERGIYLLMMLFALVLPGAYAIETSATACSGDSAVSFTTGQSAPDTATVVDSAILSFDNGASLSRQIALSSVGKAARLSLHEWHGTTNADGAAAEVSVDVINAGTIKYSYAIDPKTPGSKATFAKASENLDVTNAASISVAAFANSPKGDFADQGLSVASKANTASISKYSNSAQADKKSATASQSFKSLTGVNSGANIYGDAYAQDKYENIITIASTTISDQKEDELNPGTTTVTNYKATSAIKSETTPSATCSADLISGMYLDLNGYALATGTVGSAEWDNQMHGYASGKTQSPATISKYSQTVSAYTKSASEVTSFSSLSAASNDIYEVASNVIDTYDDSDNVVNSVGDQSYHQLSGAGSVVKGIYTPLTINGYSSNFKVQTGIGSAGSASIQSAIAPKSLESSQGSTHFFGADKYGKIWDDLSESQISISNGRLEPLSKTRPAYKATTAASPKLTNMLLTEFRGKGDSFAIACESISSALPLDVTNGMCTGQKVGTEFSSTSATASSGKLGDKKGASSKASVKLVKTY